MASNMTEKRPDVVISNDGETATFSDGLKVCRIAPIRPAKEDFVRLCKRAYTTGISTAEFENYSEIIRAYSEFIKPAIWTN